MSFSVTNRFTISGNEQVKKFIKKLNQEFIKDMNAKGSDPDTAVRRILYKHSPEIAKWLSTDQNTKRVYFQDESNWRSLDNCITFTSISNNIEELQDYLLVVLSQLDPMVLICNQHHTDYLDACYTRYSLMCDLSPVEITSSTEIPSAKNENDAYFKKVDKLILKDKQNAFKQAKKAFDWITDEMYL